ncbi:hypothetical protein GXW82_38030 [Streptacidiphilus sp. 4-A2]|nr:hypothetical protein [Streptacidiphilus sp. 4-A2]
MSVGLVTPSAGYSPESSAKKITIGIRMTAAIRFHSQGTTASSSTPIRNTARKPLLRARQTSIIPAASSSQSRRSPTTRGRGRRGVFSMAEVRWTIAAKPSSAPMTNGTSFQTKIIKDPVGGRTTHSSTPAAIQPLRIANLRMPAAR